MTLSATDSVVLGHDLPRIGVDIDPASIDEVRKDAKVLGIVLMPWQEYSIAVAETLGDNGLYLFPETADVVARQNGKSTKLAPLIRRRMRQGRRILHAAQDRIIPRRIFNLVAGSWEKGEARIRLANGQEEVTLPNGASYKIVASQRGGVRGNDADDLIIDELREQKDTEFVDAAKPTVTASSNPQIHYLSNAGAADSIVLNDLKHRAGKDPVLAYMEWSAAAELDPGDVEGWAQANPALGRKIRLEQLEQFYRSYKASGNLAGWETEHLCRWVLTMLPALVQQVYWLRARRSLSTPLRPALGIGVSPDGSRASAALSWAQGDGSIALMSLADVTGDPVDLDRFGKDLRDRALEAGVQGVAFDPWTDQHLARFFPEAKALQGAAFANASEQFVRSVETGQLHWEWADKITEDLPFTARKATSANSFVADRADPQRPITGALAAIRAVWLAGEPLQGPPTIW